MHAHECRMITYTIINPGPGHPGLSDRCAYIIYLQIATDIRFQRVPCFRNSIELNQTQPAYRPAAASHMQRKSENGGRRRHENYLEEMFNIILKDVNWTIDGMKGRLYVPKLKAEICFICCCHERYSHISGPKYELSKGVVQSIIVRSTIDADGLA